MTDKELIIAFASPVETTMTALGTTIQIVSAYQPETQGTETTATIYFSKVADKKIGMAKILKSFNHTSNKFDKSHVQRYESTFQVEAVVRNTTASDLTNSDILNMVAIIMNTDEYIQTIASSGVKILRITDIRNPYFKDEREQFQAMPSFDFTLVYNRAIISTVQKVSLIQEITKGV